MIYLTGDAHRNFEKIAKLCLDNNTTLNDAIIIMGDAGINYYCDSSDIKLLKNLSRLPINILCVHGNHEARPNNIPLYKEYTKYGGRVLLHEKYSNIVFLQDGEAYNFNGIRSIVIGGAYSVDKYYRLKRGYGWWSDEQPSNKIKTKFEDVCGKNNWKIDCIFSHTCPLKYQPIETFLPFIDQSEVDKSTEEWLDVMEDSLDYKKWYCGHYHIDKSVDKIRFLYNDIIELNI